MTARDTDAPVLSIRALEKRFGAVEVLKRISLDMAKGDFLVLVGPSGCGKSTLLNCIAGLDETSGGAILIGGRDVTRVPPRDRDIAMVFQSYALYPTMTVEENIAFGMKVRHTPKPEQEARIREVSTLLQIGHLLARKPGQLSGGQRQRVAMGRALVREPVLFLFDEPLSNLDAKLRVEMRGEIKRLHERLGTSIVYVTHDQIEAMTMGTRIVVLKDGEIQQGGTPSDIYERPANTFVADFMGSPPMNLVPARLEARNGHPVLAFSDGQSLAPATLPHSLDQGREREIIVGIRPEIFVPDGGGRMLELVPDLVENAGSDIFATARLSGKPVTVRLPGGTTVASGSPIGLSLDTGRLSFFDGQTGQRIAD